MDHAWLALIFLRNAWVYLYQLHLRYLELYLDDDKYYFLTDRIDDDLALASYPKEPYVSFLDHIMTTSTFIDLNNQNVEVETVLIEDYIGGYDIYELLVSDHRAVMFSIPFSDLPKE